MSLRFCVLMPYFCATVASMLAYLFALPFLYLIALLPMWALYRVSDGLYLLLYRVLGYRRAVVWQNLSRAFPDKSEAERQAIMKAYYHHLCDLLLETFKLLTFSQKQLQRRCSFRNMEVFEQLAAQGRSCVAVMGHLGNWEWTGASAGTFVPHRIYALYKPLSNKYFDRLVYRMRSRFGTHLLSMHESVRYMMGNTAELSATTFIADQTPAPQGAYWTTFLHQPTPIFWGTEKIARKLNLPVVYVGVYKRRRGYYEIVPELLEAEPARTRPGELTERHTRRLEQDIYASPPYWLWSHRRWKHAPPTNWHHGESLARND